MGTRSTSVKMEKPVEEKPVAHISVHGNRNGRKLSLHAPHKIFLWNAQGVYVDCAFPNPVHGHFFGGSKVRGARLGDFFSHTTSQHILEALTETLTLQVRKDVVVDIERRGTTYLADIQLFPMDRHILGWVRDQPVPARKVPAAVAEAPCLPTGISSQVGLLTEKEQQVARAFGPGHSNRHIADALHMTDRAVRFHMGNLLHKLHLPSRAHLAHLRLFETTMPDESQG